MLNLNLAYQIRDLKKNLSKEIDAPDLLTEIESGNFEKIKEGHKALVKAQAISKLILVLVCPSQYLLFVTQNFITHVMI